jgi:hypothetical protein
MYSPAAVLQLLKQCQFDAAVPLASELLREAAAESPDRLLAVARELVAWKGFFRNSAEAASSEPYFRAVHATLAELSGPDSPAAIAAAENLAGILGSLDQIEEAIVLRERVFASVRARFPADDPRCLSIRDGLAFLYQRAGREDRTASLYQDLGLCEHIAPVAEYIRGRGAKLASCCQPWSKNCHLWAYFDALLDCEGLIAGLGLDRCVEIHDHRGTHDGSERGLICTIHHDAVMGPHPADAGPLTRTISAP